MIPRDALLAAAVLGGIALAGTTLVAGVHHLTAGAIAEGERAALEGALSELLPPERYDNDAVADRVRLSPPAGLEGGGPMTVYRARRDGAPVALLVRFATPRGYNGRIELLAAIAPGGTLAGVRVVAQRETPGLGDRIARPEWLGALTGRALGDPPAPRWRVRKDGGDFDQLTGATITPRAVLDALRALLEWHRQAGLAAYGLPAETAAP